MRSCKSVRSVELEDAISLNVLVASWSGLRKSSCPACPAMLGETVRPRPASEGEEPRATLALRLTESGARGS
jgi:hypothetical protein